MRVKVRETVDFESVENADKLSPFQMLSVAFSRYYRQSKRYERNREKKLNAEAIARIRREEGLKSELLTIIYAAFKPQNNSEVKRRKIKTARITIDRSVEKEFRSIRTHREFSAYNIRLLECDRDMLRSFPDIPLVIEVSEKALGVSE